MFGRLSGAFRTGRDTSLPVWQPVGTKYPRLVDVATQSLAGRSGLYLVWHLGVRPQWIRAGYAPDLAAAVACLVETPDVMAFDVHEGPFLSWMFCERAAAAGWLASLTVQLAPVLQDHRLPCDGVMEAVTPVPCPLPPGSL